MHQAASSQRVLRIPAMQSPSVHFARRAGVPVATTSAARPPARPLPTPPPSPMRGSFIDRNPTSWTFIATGNNRRTFYTGGASCTDLCARHPNGGGFLLHASGASCSTQPRGRKPSDDPEEAMRRRHVPKPIVTPARSPAAPEEHDGAHKPCAAAAADGVVRRSFGEKVDELWVRWRKKHFGRVSWGPNNFPHHISRWLGMRHAMKRHRTLKRFKFQRMKLAAVSNLPFSKLIRVNLLPELKSSKTKAKATENVDVGLSAALVGTVKEGSGKRRRPKSKYTTS